MLRVESIDVICDCEYGDDPKYRYIIQTNNTTNIELDYIYDVISSLSKAVLSPAITEYKADSLKCSITFVTNKHNLIDAYPKNDIPKFLTDDVVKSIYAEGDDCVYVMYKRSNDIFTMPEEDGDNTMPNNDPINHPSYYTSGDIECIDAIKASMSPEEFRGYLKGCIIKYIWRYENKENPFRDLGKAKWYLTKLIEEFDFE